MSDTADKDEKGTGEETPSTKPVSPAAKPAERPAPPRSVPRSPRREPQPRRGSGIGGFLLRVMILAILAAGAYATHPIWWPKVSEQLRALGLAPAKDPRFAKLNDRIKMLEELAEARKREGDAIQDLEAQRAALSGEVGTLMKRLNGLEGAVGSVREMVEATAIRAEAEDAQAALQRLAERLQRLESGGEDVPEMMQRIARLEERVAQQVEATSDAGAASEATAATNLAVAQTIADIARRVGALEKNTNLGTAMGNGARAVVLAVGQLREAVRSGAPFADSLESFSAVAPESPATADALAALRSYADSGVPTLESLRSRFDSLADATVHARAPAKEGSDWMDRTMDSLSSLVVVRRAGQPTAGGPVEPVVAAAREALGRDDLEAAIRILERLTGPQAESVSMWLAEARARLVAERALTALHDEAVALLAANRKE